MVTYSMYFNVTDYIFWSIFSPALKSTFVTAGLIPLCLLLLSTANPFMLSEKTHCVRNPTINHVYVEALWLPYLFHLQMFCPFQIPTPATGGVCKQQKYFLYKIYCITLMRFAIPNQFGFLSTNVNVFIKGTKGCYLLYLYKHILISYKLYAQLNMLYLKEL